MKSMTVGEIAKAVDGTLICGDENTVITNITTDSRKIDENTLFIPLVGEKFDAHDFIGQTVENGVAAVFTHKDMDKIDNVAVIRVENTQKALQDTARYYKSRFNIRTVGLTGSVGKTTTKDMIASVLGTKYNTLKTQGNFNNEIGLPLTVFRLTDEHEAAVLEMGMSGFGEIHRLARIAQHDTAVMTNIGMSHIEKLGSQEGILKAKLEIIDFFDENNTLIINGDDKFLKTVIGKVKCKLVAFGVNNPDCDISAHDVEELGADGVRFKVNYNNEEYTVKVSQAGVHNVYNALAAMSVGLHYDVPIDKIIYGLENFEPTAMRMSIEKYGNVTVINDCYNASPASMEAGLKVLQSMGGRKIAVLGDMLEMGDFAPKAHENVGKIAAELGVDMVITAGENARYIAKGAEKNGVKDVKAFDTTDSAKEYVGKIIKDGDVLLVKASRGMKFENIISEIAKETK